MTIGVLIIRMQPPSRVGVMSTNPPAVRVKIIVTMLVCGGGQVYRQQNKKEWRAESLFPPKPVHHSGC